MPSSLWWLFLGVAVPLENLSGNGIIVSKGFLSPAESAVWQYSGGRKHNLARHDRRISVDSD